MTDTPTNNSVTDQVYPAFIKAQAEFLHVAKVTEGARGKFAAFPDVVEMTRPILNKNGLGITQLAQRVEGGALVVTKIIHESGQSFSDGGMFVPAAKLDPQGIGSGLSYAKRYAWLAVCGVATDDDDGAAALQGIQTEKREQAEAAALAAARLTPGQVQIITTIMAAAGHPTPNLDDKLADDYPQHAHAAVMYAKKQGVIDTDTADAMIEDAKAMDLAAVTRALQAVAA